MGLEIDKDVILQVYTYVVCREDAFLDPYVPCVGDSALDDVHGRSLCDGFLFDIVDPDFLTC